MTGGWNFADVWEAIAGVLPEAPALRHAEQTVTWATFDRRANGVAGALLAAGLGEQDKVAQYLYNGPEYIESVFGAWKAGLVPVNTNYRYGDDELVYLWDNADAAAVVFHGTFTDTVARVRGRLPKVRLWLWVDDGSGDCPDFASPYERAADAGAGRVVAPWGRSGDHLVLLYTGGTTGLPKGVMWRQDDLFLLLNDITPVRLPPDGGLEDVVGLIGRPGPRLLTACPLMHGTGAFAAYMMLSSGGSVITLADRSFNVTELLETVRRTRPQMLTIVGDVFAKPIVAELDRAPDAWDLSAVRVISSSGVMWSAETKAGLLRHNPRMVLADSLGSSEAVSVASSTTTGGGDGPVTARFTRSDNTVVVGDDGRLVEPGSGDVGLVGIRGHIPLGYYKDPAKSAATFRTIDGVRYSIPGDYATIEADGTLVLMGRGSGCINSGGEKIFPEEVEEVLKLHPGVADAAVVGVPDDRFGEVVAAVVEAEDVDPDELIALVKTKLAAYKAPKWVGEVPSLRRAPNGKLDYRHWKAWATERRVAEPAGRPTDH